VEPKPPAPRALSSNDSDDVQLDLHHGHHHQLRDALHGIHYERVLAAVPARDEHLALVVGVDEPHQVAEHDAVLVAQARARNDDAASRVGEVDREARGDERAVAGPQRDRLVDAGAQVEARGAAGGIGGQLRADPLVEDPDVEFLQSRRPVSGE
jgi:hypothetical protein